MGFPDVSACTFNAFGVCQELNGDARKDDLLSAAAYGANRSGGEPPQGPGGDVPAPQGQGIGDLRLLPTSATRPGVMFINMATLPLPSSGFGLLRQAEIAMSGGRTLGADTPRPLRERPQRLGQELLAGYKNLQQVWAAVTNRPGLSPELRAELITLGSGAVEGMRAQAPAVRAATEQAARGQGAVSAAEAAAMHELLITPEIYRVGLAALTGVLAQARDFAAAGNTQAADEVLRMLTSQMTPAALAAAARHTGERSQQLVAASEQGHLSPHFQGAVADIDVVAYGLRLMLSDEVTVPRSLRGRSPKCVGVNQGADVRAR